MFSGGNRTKKHLYLSFLQKLLRHPFQNGFTENMPKKTAKIRIGKLLPLYNIQLMGGTNVKADV